MTYLEKLDAIRAFNDRIKAEKLTGSTGSTGKLVDFWVRDFLMAHGVSSADDVRCRRAAAPDWSIRISGKLVKGETKTNMGEWKVPCARVTAEDIFPDKDYVVYAAEVAGINERNFADNLFVFTREQFIELLTVTGKNGLESSCRYNAKHGTVGIQAWSIYNKTTGRWCEARLKKYYKYLSVNEIPTLRDFRDTVRG